MRFPVWLASALLVTELIVWPLSAAPVNQGPIKTVVYNGQKYSICEFDPAKDDVRLFWADDRGNVLGNFTALQKQIQLTGGRIIFAANAGMFRPTGEACGLLVQNGTARFPLNLADGTGNFYLKPNGVFFIDTQHKAHVTESGDYATQLATPLWATQSGPLLMGGGHINPDFMPDSKNRNIRSGVGVTTKGAVIFALSQMPVTFYEFAELFRMRLDCPNALYLDGGISDFWQAGDIESEGEHHFGPMIGVLAGPLHEGVTAAPAAP